ncbi:hypothetical protein TB1_039728 [Malus domestica]
MKAPTGGPRIVFMHGLIKKFYFEGNHGFLADKGPFCAPSRTYVGCPANHTPSEFAMRIRDSKGCIVSENVHEPTLLSRPCIIE